MYLVLEVSTKFLILTDTLMSTIMGTFYVRGVVVTTHPHLQPKLGMSWAIPLLTLCVCMACSVETFTFAF